MKIPEEDLERKRRSLQHVYDGRPVSWLGLTIAISLGVFIGNLIFAIVFLIYLNTSAEYNLPPALQNPLHHRSR